MQRLLRRVLVAMALTASVGHADDSETTSRPLLGAGIALANRYIADWEKSARRYLPVAVQYSAVGNGAALKMLAEKSVDFCVVEGAGEEIAAGTIAFPLLATQTRFVCNLPGVERVNLSLELIADIFLGNVSAWSDKRIAALNEGTSLPDLPISVYPRIDASYETLVVTRVLSEVSESWRSRVGAAFRVSWPLRAVPGHGTEAAAHVPGSISFASCFATPRLLMQPEVMLVGRAPKGACPCRADGSSVEPLLVGARWRHDWASVWLSDKSQYPLTIPVSVLVRREDLRAPRIRVLLLAIFGSETVETSRDVIPISPGSREQIREELK